MKAKTFDCVEIQHRGAERIREQISSLTQEQELAFWQERSQVLRHRQKIAKGERHAQGEMEKTTG